MNKKEHLALINFIEGLLDELKKEGQSGKINRAYSQINYMEARSLDHDCEKELKTVDGAMRTVGEAVCFGKTYELSVTFWRKE